MMIILSCVAGAVFAFFLSFMLHLFVLRERSKQLMEEDNTDEATATILEKEKKAVREVEKGTQWAYKVTYEFSAEKADGTPCTVRVFGREIHEDAWNRLDEGGPVQVLYLAGRPGSCRMKDMVGDDVREYSNMHLIMMSFGFLFVGVFFSAFACAAVGIAYGLVSEKLGHPRRFSDEPTSRIGIGLGFFLSFIVCSVLRAGQAYLNRNTDAIYDIGLSGMMGTQTVVVEELHESDAESSDNFSKKRCRKEDNFKPKHANSDYMENSSKFPLACCTPSYCL